MRLRAAGAAGAGAAAGAGGAACPGAGRPGVTDMLTGWAIPGWVRAFAARPAAVDLPAWRGATMNPAVPRTARATVMPSAVAVCQRARRRPPRALLCRRGMTRARARRSSQARTPSVRIGCSTRR